jgi:hypothetical protein
MRCDVPDARCMVRGAWYEVRGARYEAQDTRYVVRGTGYTCWVCWEGTCKDGNDVHNMGASWVRTPLPEGELVGAAYPLHQFYTKMEWALLCKYTHAQIAHKFDACALFACSTCVCGTWYMVWGMRCGVCGTWCNVRSTWCEARATRCKTLCMITEFKWLCVEGGCLILLQNQVKLAVNE